jgi:hypothetical protein
MLLRVVEHPGMKNVNMSQTGRDYDTACTPENPDHSLQRDGMSPPQRSE